MLGLEGYASGRFQLRAEVKRYFEQFPEFPKNAKGEVSNEHVNRILSRVIYAGYIQSDIMDVSLRPAQNEPMISLATYQKIQMRMQEKPKVPARKDLNEDFPMRGAVRCADCDSPLTACWTKGRSKHYPYYYCFTKRCESYGKAIQREKIEGEFESLLHTLENISSKYTNLNSGRTRAITAIDALICDLRDSRSLTMRLILLVESKLS